MNICRGTLGLLAGLLSMDWQCIADDGPFVRSVSSAADAAEVQAGERVRVEALFAPIGSLKLQVPGASGAASETVEKAPVLDELISQRLAADSAAAYFGEQRGMPAGPRSRPLSAVRNPYAFRHQPLYFAQPAMEVSGQSMVGLNPFITVGWFAVDAALLPVRLVTQPPCSRVSTGQ